MIGTVSSNIGSLIAMVINGILVPVLFAVAFIAFLWGAFETFITGAGSADVKNKGKNLMLWSIIAFFVLIAVWILVNILAGTVSFNATVTPPQNISS